MKTFVALVFINNNEVRLCLIQADTINQAHTMLEQAYSVLHSRNSVRFQVYDTAMYHKTIDELNITFLS